MRTIFKKVMAGVTTVALAATLLVGVQTAKSVNAEETEVQLPNWSFAQGGQYNPKEKGNEGYIESVVMNGTDETISGWLTGEGSMNQVQSATQASTGFKITINNTGWDAKWEANPVTINPWSIQANLHGIPTQAGHIYTVSFKASASQNKLAYVTFGTDMEGTPAPYGEGNAPEGDAAIIKIGLEEKEYTYTFTNWVSAEEINMDIMLGAFNADYDYAGNLISDYVAGYAQEKVWSGDVTINDLKVIDKGLNPESSVEIPPLPTPEPTVEPTTLADASGDAEVTTVAPTTPEVSTIPSTSEVTTAAPAPVTTVAPAPVTTVAPNNNPGGNVTPATTANNNSVTTPNNNTPATPAQTAKKLGKVKKVKAKNNKKGRVTVTWKKVAHAKKYQVKVGKKSYTSKKTKYVVKKGLKKGKTYKIKVRAKAANGYKAGAWSKAVKVKIKK